LIFQKRVLKVKPAGDKNCTGPRSIQFLNQVLMPHTKDG